MKHQGKMNKRLAEEILELTPSHGVTSYTKKMLKDAYISKAKKSHPDTQQATNSEGKHANQAMSEINQAHEYLVDLFRSSGREEIPASQRYESSSWVKDPQGWAHSTSDNTASTYRQQRQTYEPKSYNRTNNSSYWYSYSVWTNDSDNQETTYHYEYKDSDGNVSSKTTKNDESYYRKGAQAPPQNAYTNYEHWKKAADAAQRAADFMEEEKRKRTLSPKGIIERIWGNVPKRFKAYIYTIAFCFILMLFVIFLSIILAIAGKPISTFWSIAALLLFIFSIFPFLSKGTYKLWEKYEDWKISR